MFSKTPSTVWSKLQGIIEMTMYTHTHTHKQTMTHTSQVTVWRKCNYFCLNLNLIFALILHFAWWTKMDLVSYEVAQSHQGFLQRFVFKQSFKGSTASLLHPLDWPLCPLDCGSTQRGKAGPSSPSVTGIGWAITCLCLSGDLHVVGLPPLRHLWLHQELSLTSLGPSLHLWSKWNPRALSQASLATGNVGWALQLDLPCFAHFFITAVMCEHERLLCHYHSPLRFPWQSVYSPLLEVPAPL